MGTTTDNSYTKTLTVDATAKDVFHALSEPDAITSWWSAASTTGSGRTGGELHITFGTEEQPTVMRVLAAHAPDVVIWEVAASPLVPEWVGTRPTFAMTAVADGCRLDFRPPRTGPQSRLLRPMRHGLGPLPVPAFRPRSKPMSGRSTGRPAR